ncbi:unknown protein [Microcystis aeruginosa NIES-843]|uniref:Uncharacterized protein n=1 Tax=Microcystis aeruginosa (strain NIES-843 / IAM M-2473) TaxID=449447 RepID=B0JJ92_MICAN|nr:unknown protein [Microcystis aeruginosa NIES-843]
MTPSKSVKSYTPLPTPVRLSSRPKPAPTKNFLLQTLLISPYCFCYLQQKLKFDRLSVDKIFQKSS